MKDVLIFIRVALLVVAALNMLWTFKGVISTGKNRSPLATFAAALFWLSAGTVCFQGFSVFGQPSDVTRIGSCLVLLIGFATAATLSRQAKHLALFGRILLNVEVAMAIVDLWRVDPDAAEREADRCRKLLAEKMVRG